MNKLPSVKSAFSRHVMWNLLGQAAPIIAAFVSIPILIAEIGTDKFGMITIAWMLIGYFSLFDFGIGRALTQLVSKRRAQQDSSESSLSLIWTGNFLMLGLGLIAALLLALLCHTIIYQWLNIPETLRADAANGLMMIVPAIPLTVFATGARGVLEAYQEFKAINLLRVPLGVLMFAAPVMVLPFSHSLEMIFLALTFTRLLTALAFLWLCARKISNFWQISFAWREVPVLLGFGGWMTVSNVISPIMVQMDRFFIGAMLSISAVAYYTTPYEVMIKMLVVPAAIAGVAFPNFALLHSSQQWGAIRSTYKKSLLYTSLLALPVAVALIGAPFILELWLNPTFSQQSTVVMQILAVGVFVNGLAHIPYAFIQGIGQPQITAALHIIELVIYVPLLVVLIQQWGINGAAWAWLIRVTIDAAALFYISHKKMAFS